MVDVFCTVCGGEALPIAYGFPTDETIRAVERGELVLGGCVPPFDASWRCTACGHEGGGELSTDHAWDLILQNIGGRDAADQSPTTWGEIGLDRSAIVSRGLALPDLPVVVRGYVPDSGGWAHIQDEADDRFAIGVAELRVDADERPLRLGDVVLYLGETEGYDGSTTLWAPALVVAFTAARQGRRTVWTLTDHQLSTADGAEQIALPALPPAARVAVQELALSAKPATPEQRQTLLSLWGLA